MAAMDEKMQESMVEGKSPTSIPARVVGFAMVAAIVASLLALAGLSVAAVVTTAAVSVPLLLFLSPILVPIGTVVVITTAGILGVGAAVVGALTVFSWLYSYKKGRPVAGAQQAESLKRSVAELTTIFKEKGGEATSYPKEKEKGGEATSYPKEKAVEPKERVQERAIILQKGSEPKERVQERAILQKGSSSQSESGGSTKGKAPIV